MPSFFPFTQGTESHNRNSLDASPLLGRFRAVPPQRPEHRPSQLGLLSASAGHGSVHVGYGSVLAAALSSGVGNLAEDEESEDDDDDPDRNTWSKRCCRAGRKLREIWVNPKQGTVKQVVSVWWTRYAVLILMPAALAVAWCAIPFPQYPFEDDDDMPEEPGRSHKVPGHGEARVQVNFWFFLFVFYSSYNLTALAWITKVFNLYSLNWWPQSLGFPLTVALIAALSIAVPIPIYLLPETNFLTIHNTAWISWTFIIMAMPVAIAFIILMTNERHLGLRQSLSETQRIFTSSWWTGEPETLPRSDHRRRATLPIEVLHPNGAFHVAEAPRPLARVSMRRNWLPASFVRFIWFCLALSVGLLAYVIGEAYAEIYLRTLPHNKLETIVYVYSWVLTVHLLDGLTAWILGVREGERVGSYPLSWVFKLYFMLTYQTFVRALYARLRSPSEFMLLQLLSSTSLIVLSPLTMSPLFHRILTILGINSLSYGSYQKLCIRNVFIRFVAENVSMVTFLGSILVLHFGANKDVYPYFAFDDGAEYDFDLTFSYSTITWACELAAALCVRILIRIFFRADVDEEGKLDLVVWPELLPTSAAVTLHVLQNMLFSIIRLQFR